MNVVWTTLVRELMSYLFSPVGYVIAILVYLWRGFEVSSLIELFERTGVDQDTFATSYVFQLSSVFMMVLVPPILTMRCFAEERRTGSLEVLMTAPVRLWEIVAGKWLAAFAFFALLWGPTLLLLLVLRGPSFLDAELALGPVLSGYLGVTLVGAMLLAVGCFTSSLTDNQLLASLSAMVLTALLLAAPGMLMQSGATAAAADSTARVLAAQVNVWDHLTKWFLRGLIDSGQVVFYLAGTLYFLFLTTVSLEARRWR